MKTLSEVKFPQYFNAIAQFRALVKAPAITINERHEMLHNWNSAHPVNRETMVKNVTARISKLCA